MVRASRIGETLRERRIVVTYEDITERIQAEKELEHSRQELRNLSAHQQTVREEERTRIAREIHDELGQTLTALKMDLAWLKNRLPAGMKPLHAKVQQMSKLADATIESVHRIATELRPGLLDDLGLAAAIEWQAADFQNRSGIACKAHAGGRRPGAGPRPGDGALPDLPGDPDQHRPPCRGDARGGPPGAERGADRADRGRQRPGDHEEAERRRPRLRHHRDAGAGPSLGRRAADHGEPRGGNDGYGRHPAPSAKIAGRGGNGGAPEEQEP